MKPISVFCANEQIDTDHALDINSNGEITLTCKCGRFLKLPGNTDGPGFKAFIAAHKAANMGQISLDAIEAKKAELLNALDEQ